MDDSLAGSELFGHVQGSFTDARVTRTGQFASAHGGTLFLDEIGKASRAVQQKLLHAIEYREIRPLGADRSVRVDVRIVAATNVSLRTLVDEGSFLPDLSARLEMYRVELPSLRDRRGDIVMLMNEAVDRYSLDCGYSTAPIVSNDVLSAFQRADWPNNIREPRCGSSSAAN